MYTKYIAIAVIIILLILIANWKESLVENKPGNNSKVYDPRYSPDYFGIARDSNNWPGNNLTTDLTNKDDGAVGAG